MLTLLLVALLVSGVVAEDAGAEPANAAEKAVPIESAATASNDADSAEQRMRMRMDPEYEQEGYRDDHLYLKAKLDGDRPEGPLVARSLHSSIGHGPNIAAQDDIIRFTYSPAYYEPMWVLDYRFFKSGGRRYTRAPGGQVLILPRSYVHSEGDGTHDYDSMIEHLRLKLIAEQNQRMREHGFAHQYDRGHFYEQDYLGQHESMHDEHEPIQHLERERTVQREREPILQREREPILQRERKPILQREREPIGQREREAILHRERKPIQHRQPEPVFYGPMEPVRMEREREQRERMMNVRREHLMYH